MPEAKCALSCSLFFSSVGLFTPPIFFFLCFCNLVDCEPVNESFSSEQISGDRINRLGAKTAQEIVNNILDSTKHEYV